MLKLVVRPLTGFTGVTVMTGVMFSDQLSRTPVVPVLLLVIWSFQVPSATFPSRPVSVAVEPWGYAGRNVPVNGAFAPARALSAESSRTVLTKLAPVPPTPENRGTWVPSGAIGTAARAESVLIAPLNATVILAILKVLFELGTVSGTVSTPGQEVVAAGIVWPTAVELRGCGPLIEPSGPMIPSTWPAVNVL